MKLVIAMAAVFSICSANFAATIKVPLDQPTIQAGINAASNGDTVLVAAGTYVGSGNKGIAFGGKSLCVVGAGGAASTIVDLQGSGAFIDCVESSPTTPSLIGFTIIHSGAYYSAIRCKGSSLIISDCIFRDNAPWNAAVYFNGNDYLRVALSVSNPPPSPRVERCTFVSNSGQNGVIYFQYNSVNVQVSNCIFVGNTCDGAVIQNGGNATFSISCSDIIGNLNGDWTGALAPFAAQSGNFSADPLFCDSASNKFTLWSSSLCLAANSPCGKEIGAMGMGCGNRTLRVPSAFSTIQSAIDSAADGDTVLIADGHYFERISFKGKNITVASHLLLDNDTMHIQNTFIDGQGTDTTDSWLGAVTFSNGEDTTATLMGLTVQNGSLTTLSVINSHANIYDCRLLGGNAYIRDFINQSQFTARLVRTRVGSGGISLGQYSKTYLSHCMVNGDIADYAGGSYLKCDSSIVGNIAIVRTADLRYSTANNVNVMGLGGLTIKTSTITNVSCHDAGYGASFLNMDSSTVGNVRLYSTFCTITRSTIKDSITTIGFGSGHTMDLRQTTVLGPIAISHSSLSMDSSLIDVSHFGLQNPSEFAIVDSDTDRVVTIRCSNISGFSSNWISGTPVLNTSNLTLLNPRFCDPVNGDYQLKNSSPCAPANNACGIQIGAYGVGCQNIAPQITSLDTISVNEDARLLYRGTANDPDGPTLSWSFINKPSWLVSNADSIYGIPHYPVHDTSLDVIASDGFLMDTQKVSVKVHQLTPEVPIMRVDADSLNLHVLSSTPQISWHYFDPTGTTPQTECEIAVGTDADWTYSEMWNPAPIVSPDSFVTYAGLSLIRGHTYYLRLRAYNGTRWSPYKYGSFRLNSKPTVPIAKSPTNDQITGATPILWVQNASDPEGDVLFYDFQGTHDTACASGPAISLTHIAGGTDSTGGQVTSALGEDCRYSWQVRSFDGFEYSEWSPIAQFRVNGVSEPPSPFSLASPPTPDNKPVFTLLPILQWNQSTDPDPGDTVRYKVELSLSSSFALSFIRDSLLTTQYQLPDSLQFGTRYWWRVSAKDKTGNVTMCQSAKDFWTWRLGDVNSSHSTDLADLSTLVSFLTGGGAEITPRMAGDLNADCKINLADLSVLVSYLTGGGAVLKVGC